MCYSRRPLFAVAFGTQTPKSDACNTTATEAQGHGNEAKQSQDSQHRSRGGKLAACSTERALAVGMRAMPVAIVWGGTGVQSVQAQEVQAPGTYLHAPSIEDSVFYKSAGLVQST